MVLVVKNLPANAGDRRDAGSVPGSGRSPGGGHGTPLQYSCLENPHGQRSLAARSPWGHRESDTTARLSTAQQTQIVQCFVFYKTVFLPSRKLPRNLMLKVLFRFVFLRQRGWEQ